MAFARHPTGCTRDLSDFYRLCSGYASRISRPFLTLGWVACLWLGLLPNAQQAHAQSSDVPWANPAYLSGSWYDPNKDGQGMVVQVFNPTTVLMTWFTFDHQGNPAWLQGVGTLDGDTVRFAELLRFEGPKFGPTFDPKDRVSIPAGSLEITFHHCHAATANYQGQDPFVDDELKLERLTSVAGFNCSGNQAAQRFPLHHGLSGAWYSPAQDGQGWMVEVLNDEQALVYWFTYDKEGQQHWLLGVGNIVNESIVVNDLQWARGARFGPSFNAADVERLSWGKVTLKLYPCTGASVSYRHGVAHRAEVGEIANVESLVALPGTTPCPKYIDTWKATRFLDQAAFGPTPTEQQRVYAYGMEAWLDEQIALPVSTVQWQDLQCEGNFFDHDNRHRVPKQGVDIFFHSAAALRILDLFVGAPDQLRLRMSWALSQLLVISGEGGIPEVGQATYFNILQQHALGNFKDLLRDVTLSPSMGRYLDNAGSKTSYERCQNCIPNENYARELLMLFTLGVNELNLDGSKKKNADGTYIETFSQDDVIALSRALSGWDHVDRIDTPDRVDYYNRQEDCRAKGGGNGFIGGYEQPMRPVGFGAHDRNEKRFLGRTFPAGQTIHQDLESVLDALMDHPNIAPFVSQRLIRHLTTSNPSPAYIERVARVFLDNGEGVKGDLAAVAKAIIMDPEARAGDDPESMPRNFGRIRDLVHQKSAIYRGLECTETPSRNYWGGPMANSHYGLRVLPDLPRNRPLGAPQVFNFYPPEHKVPGMEIIAPEHLLLNFSGVQARVQAMPGDRRELAVCNYDELRAAIMAGPDVLIQFMKDRYLRGRSSFAHESFMRDYAESLRQWLINSEESSEDGVRYEGYQLAMFFGYTLLGQEFGIVR